MLGTGSLALAAFDAVTGPAPFGDSPGIDLACLFHVIVDLLDIKRTENLRDIDVCGAAVRTVMAGGTGDGACFPYDLLGPAYHFLLRIGEGTES